MKSSFVDVINIRRMAFATIARMAYNNESLSGLQDETYKDLPGEVATFRENVFRERAIYGERLRMVLGLDARTADETLSITEGIEDIDIESITLGHDLVSVIKIACEACPENHVSITADCRYCLAHPCSNVCPANAIYSKEGKMHIDQDKCIKCSKCVRECPYHAIIETVRPCSDVCAVDAINTDYLNRAEIDHDACVACGACLTACPFGAISDKSQIYQVIKAIQSSDKVYAIIAPSFVGQFGPLTKPNQVLDAIIELGMDGVVEVGLGADLTTMHEAQEFLEYVPDKLDYMGTSCCYSWKLMVNKKFPDQKEFISESSTPMVYTAQQIKKREPEAKVVFIGPCLSKKLEATQEHVKTHVDFVLTFEELLGMFVARDIEPASIETADEINHASETGRNYAIGGGVAAAVVARAKELDPDRELKVERADGLKECVTLMRLAKAGRKNGMLLEGMACTGGCVGGPGTVVPIQRSTRAVKEFAKESKFSSPAENTMIPPEDKV